MQAAATWSSVGTHFRFSMSTNITDEQRTIRPTYNGHPLGPYTVAVGEVRVVLASLIPHEAWWGGPTNPGWTQPLADPQETNRVIAVLVVINDVNFSWSTDDWPLGGLDVQSVALHELGHALGLTHSSNPDAIMYNRMSLADYYLGAPHRNLHADDITRLAALPSYGSPAPNITQPLSPTLQSPPSGTTVSERRPTLRWYASVNATKYYLQLSTSRTFETVTANMWTLSTSYPLDQDLTPGTTYYWRVKATKNGLNSDWSVRWQFTVAASNPNPWPTSPPPTPPPADGIEVLNISSHTVQPGEEFTPSVTIRVTSGYLDPTRGDHLHATPEDNGNVFGAWPVQGFSRRINTGETWTWNASTTTQFKMRAPDSEGLYQSVWQLRVGGNHIGPQIRIPITVRRVQPPPPAGNWHIEYFRHPDFNDRCFDGYENGLYINKNWGSGPPTSGCPNDDFSARFTSRFDFQGGDYRFHCQHDDGCKVYIDGQLWIDAWWNSSFDGHDMTRSISSGSHEVKVEFYEHTGDARLEVWWQGAGFLPRDENCPDGQWCAAYHLNRDLAGGAAVRRAEGDTLDHTWDLYGPVATFPTDNFSAKFDRTTAFQCGTYRFYVFSDDGVRLDIDGVRRLDRWQQQVAAYTVDVALTSGTHNLHVEYYEQSGSAALRVVWAQIANCAPPAPSGLTARAATCSEVDLAWQDNASNEQGYVVYRDGAPIARLGPNATTYQDTQVAPSPMTYSYTVRAVGVDAESLASNQVSVTKVPCPPASPCPTSAWPLWGAAPGTSNFQVLGQHGGDAQAVAVRNPYAYVGVGPRVLVFDVGDPFTPRCVAQTGMLPGVVQDIVLAGDYAYVAAGSAGLYILNVATPAAPTLVSFYETPGYAGGVSVAGEYAFIADGQAGLQIVRVSDPTAPVPLGAVDTPGSATDVAIVGNYAYVADWSSGLRIINVANPAAPFEVGALDTPGSAHRLALQGNYAYIADEDHGLRIIDISNPAAPTEVGAFDLADPVEVSTAVAVVGSYAYVTDFNRGPRVIDISDPAHPIGVGLYNQGYLISMAIAVADNYAYVPTLGGGLAVLGLFNPWQPVGVGYFPMPGYTDGALAVGNIVYGVTRTGLETLDATSLAAMRWTTRVGRYVLHAVASGNYLYAANGSLGISVVNIADPASPREVASLVTPGYAWRVAVVGATLYVAARDAGLRIIDISDPLHPRGIGFYDTPGTAIGVAVAGGYAYVGDGSAGVRVIDVSNPAAPVEVGSFATTASASGVAVSGNYVYVGTNELRILNVSDPTHPVEVGSVGVNAEGIVIQGNYAFTSGSDVWAVDIHDPTHPSVVGYFQTPGMARMLSSIGDRLYVGDGDGGVLILRPTGRLSGGSRASDLDGDGKADLLWRQAASGQDAVWLMDGANAASMALTTPVADLAWRIVGLGDLDNDGKTDLVWRNTTSGQTVAWLMNGASVTSYAWLPTVADPNWTLVGVGDLDGDGQADLVWRNTATGQTNAWLMNGASVTAYPFLPTVADPNWKLVGVGDLNADGKADLVWRNTATGQTVTWLMDGATITGYTWLPTVADPNWQLVSLGDLNADGASDLLWRNTVSGQNIAWLMDGGNVSSYPWLPSVADPNWQLVAVSDLDGDGQADLVWRNTATGQNSLWLMEGATVRSYTWLATVADPNWRVVSPTSLLGALNGLLPGPTKMDKAGAEGPMAGPAAKDAAPMWSDAPKTAPPMGTAPESTAPFWKPASPSAEPPGLGR